MAKFKWDDSALIPESVEIHYPVKFAEDGSVLETVTVQHFELARPHLVQFIAEALDKNFVREIETEVDGKKVMESKRVPFKDVEEEQRALLFDGLAKSTRGKKDAKFFEKLSIGARGMDALVEMFFALNHIAEVTATGGNWMLLPTMREAMAEAANPDSESQNATTAA
jgi:hypothetical protein